LPFFVWFRTFKQFKRVLAYAKYRICRDIKFFIGFYVLARLAVLGSGAGNTPALISMSKAVLKS